jgi:hypothetical protein
LLLHQPETNTPFQVRNTQGINVPHHEAVGLKIILAHTVSQTIYSLHQAQEQISPNPAL